MIDLEKDAKENRVVWIVLADNRYLYMARSGNGMKHLYQKYKRVQTLSASVSKETADKLKDAIAYIGDITNKQPTLI